MIVTKELVNINKSLCLKSTKIFNSRASYLTKTNVRGKKELTLRDFSLFCICSSCCINAVMTFLLAVLNKNIA